MVGRPEENFIFYIFKSNDDDSLKLSSPLIHEVYISKEENDLLSKKKKRKNLLFCKLRLCGMILLDS